MICEAVKMTMLLPAILMVLLDSIRGTGTSEARLLQTLFNTSYDKYQRPVNTPHPTPVEVTVSLAVQALQSVSERTQMMTINTWVSLEWNDYRLRWDPTLFDGTFRISFPTNDLWTPRIVLENSANRKVDVPVLDDFSRVLVSHDGVILYDAPETLSSLCAVDVSNFPFDQQNCSLNFTNLADSIDLVKLTPVAKVHRYKYDKTQWKLVNVTGKETVVKDPFHLSGDLFYSYVHFEIILHRLPLYHLTTSALPSTSLTLLAFTVYLMPPDCSEKVSMGVSILLGLTVFQLVVADTLPETGPGRQPLLGTYLTMNFAVVAITLFCTAVSMGVYSHRGPVKNIVLRKVFLELLPPVLFVRRPRPDSCETETGTKTSSLAVEETEFGTDTDDRYQIGRQAQEAEAVPFSNVKDDSKKWRQERWTITIVLDRMFFIMTATLYIITTIVLALRLL